MKFKAPIIITGSLLLNIAFAEGGSIPQLDFATWPKQIFWLVIIFGGLYIALQKIALPQVSETIALRENRIADRLADAKRLFKESQESQSEQNLRLVSAREEANKIRVLARDEVGKLHRAELSQLDVHLDEKLEQAEASIAQQSKDALLEINDSAAKAAEQIYTQITGKPITEGAAQNIISALGKGN